MGRDVDGPPPAFAIADREIGPGRPTYVIAEMSANHNQDFDRAVKIVEAAKEAGADAVKLQTYTADTLTLDCANEHFQVKGTIWEGRTLHELYREAMTPWEWHPRLKEVAQEVGIDLFSTPYDATAVEFLETMGVPVYKIASFEVIDLPLLVRVAETGKPIIMSTGMASLDELDEAMATLRDAGAASRVALLKCTSAYPAPPEEMNLRTVPDLAARYGVCVGLSDHTLGTDVPALAVALGACIVEKHFTLSRADPGPDSTFSLEPQELAAMVRAIRRAEAALGSVQYGLTPQQEATSRYRRSLFVAKDMARGEVFTESNVRSVRPAVGLHPRHLRDVLGRTARSDIAMGTPLSWHLIEGESEEADGSSA